jgi:toxoflavin synthase
VEQKAISSQIGSPLAFKQYVENYSLLRLCGNVKGKSILHISAKDDLSEEFINRGASWEATPFLDLEYLNLELIKQSLPDKKFDLIIGLYLLQKARDQDTIAKFAEMVAERLNPGGRWVSINDNPGNAAEYFKKYKKYGFQKKGNKEKVEGEPIVYTFFHEDGTTSEDFAYYLSLQTHEHAFKQAGFDSFRWKNLQVSEKSNLHHSPDYWRILLNHPPFIGMEAKKDL